MPEVSGRHFTADTSAKTTFRVGRSGFRFFVPIMRRDGKGVVCWIESNADESPSRTDDRAQKVIRVLDAGYEELADKLIRAGR